jgi:hypothetical protein
VEFSIAGALAMAAHGYVRATEDVDVLLTPEGLAAFKRRWLGRGYVERFPGSKGVRDTENETRIDFLLTGDFPGDGKPKAVAFPHPGEDAVRGERADFLGLAKLVELKIASGMSAPHRLRDLADVIELIRVNRLPASFAEGLDASVRGKFEELRRAAESAPEEE